MKTAYESERFYYAIRNAAQIGHAARFWINDGDAKTASRKARHAARWAMKAETISSKDFSRLANSKHNF